MVYHLNLQLLFENIKQLHQKTKAEIQKCNEKKSINDNKKYPMHGCLCVVAFFFMQNWTFFNIKLKQSLNNVAIAATA